jgi:hypothetical protein
LLLKRAVVGYLVKRTPGSIRRQHGKPEGVTWRGSGYASLIGLAAINDRPGGERMPEFKTGSVLANGLRLHYLEMGTGATRRTMT